jgi:hypothetical protein
LKWQIDSELGSLGQLADELDKFMKDVSGRQLSVIELGGVGSILQGFYNGVEKIFERIAIVIDEKLPEGDSWHILLLNQMETASVIDHELASRLSEYLRFRHLFRNIYGHKLQWEKCQPLAENVSETLKKLREQLSYFLNRLQDSLKMPKRKKSLNLSQYIAGFYSSYKALLERFTGHSYKFSPCSVCIFVIGLIIVKTTISHFCHDKYDLSDNVLQTYIN